MPSPLTAQWQDELQDKFDETFEIVDSHIETGQVAGNVWQRKPQCIASIDYAKRDASDSASARSVRDAVLQCGWDLVIVDEAHKASAARYGDEVKPTKRYKLIEELARSPQVHHMLLLTATPHQGKEDQFRLFLRLLDPDQFEAQDYGEIQRLLAEERCPFFQRRIKEDLRDFDGKKLFLPRNAWTQDFELTRGERTLYKAVTKYIQEFLGKALTGRRRMAVALARSVLQRRLASSLHAITESLRRRHDRLVDKINAIKKYYLHAFSVGVVGEAPALDPREARTEPIDGRCVPVLEQLDGSYEIASQDILHDLTPIAIKDVAKIDPTPFAPELTLGPIDSERTRRASSWIRLHVQHAMVKEQQKRRGEDARRRSTRSSASPRESSRRSRSKRNSRAGSIRSSSGTRWSKPSRRTTSLTRRFSASERLRGRPLRDGPARDAHPVRAA